MAGEASEVQIAGFLIALRAKGETEDELAGLARTMRALAARVECGRDDLLDTAGTGGGRPTFNLSTTAAPIPPAARGAVAKNRKPRATRLSGGAHALPALRAPPQPWPEAGAAGVPRPRVRFPFSPSPPP